MRAEVASVPEIVDPAVEAYAAAHATAHAAAHATTPSPHLAAAPAELAERGRIVWRAG